MDEIYEKLEELELTVKTSITTNSDSIDDMVLASRTTRQNLYAAAEIDLDQEWSTVWLRVLKIKELSVGYNIAVCLQWREDVILRLPQRCRDDMNTCLDPFDTLLDSIGSDSKAKISVLINEVDSLNGQVVQCDGSLLCLEPLVTQIELASIEIPQKAAVEVENAKTMIAEIDVETKDCIDAGVAYMVATGHGATDVIEDCANNIVG